MNLVFPLRIGKGPTLNKTRKNDDGDPACKGTGFRIGILPLPDGTYRAYKEFGRDASELIYCKWEADCQLMLWKMGNHTFE